MSGVELKNLSKSYGNVMAVSHINLKIEEGIFFSILGPSGCGKTTTLRMIAGFVQPSSGQIFLDNEDITNLPPEKRNMGLVFQNYAIFPHMNIFDNIAFGMKMRQLSRNVIHERVTQSLRQVGLSGYEKRYSRQISGGEQQRVALARVLVIRPKVLLLDEPLSALDKLKREEMQFWIKDLQRTVGITTIYVTHDQVEAMTVSDKIMSMNAGRIEQIGSPRDLYERPANKFVAKFIGESNIFDGVVKDLDPTTFVAECEEGLRIVAPKDANINLGSKVSIVIRPEKLEIHSREKNKVPEGKYSLEGGVIQEQVYRGMNIRYTVIFPNNKLVTVDSPLTSEKAIVACGETVILTWGSEDISILTD